MAQVKPLLFALGLDPNWGLYAPALVEFARSRGLGIHVLETGAPLGTGTFTSNAVQNEMDPAANPQAAAIAPDPEPLPEGMKDFGDPYPEPNQSPEKEPVTPGDVTLAWPDTATATAKMDDFVQSLVDYFKGAGFVASGEWRPDFEMASLGEYARRIGANVVALPKAGFFAGFIQGPIVAKLKDDGFHVELLEPVSAEELAALEARAAATGDQSVNARERATTDLRAAMTGERPVEDLVGRTARVDVPGVGGTMLIRQNEQVTQATLDKARADNLLEALTNAVEIPVNLDAGNPQPHIVNTQPEKSA
jgi:hypothetical protein